MKKSLRTLALCAVLCMLSVTLIPGAYALSCPECGSELYSQGVDRPTCTEGSTAFVSCGNCDFNGEINVPPLGHSYYKDHEITETCTEQGSAVLICSRCGDSYRALYDPLVHDYESEEIAPTCTEDGATVYTCTRCGDSYSEPIPALGHDFETIETPATCTEPGSIVNTCKNCGESSSETLAPLGHSFSEPVTVKEPTQSEEGSAVSTCSVCGAEETTVLPCVSGQDTGTAQKKNPAPVIIAAVVTALGIGGIGFAVSKSAKLAAAAKAAKAAEAAAEVSEAAGLGMVTLQKKDLLLCLAENAANKKFEEELLKRPYLDIKKLPYSDLAKLPGMAKEESPDLIILSCLSSERFTEISNETLALDDEAQFAAIDESGANAEYIAFMKEGGKLLGAASGSDSTEKRIAKLILPLFKPSQSKENYIENATLITDALGLPIVSMILNVFVVGGDVTGAIKAKGLNAAETSDFINDVAGVLGLDVLANVAEAIRLGLEQKDRIEDKKAVENS